MSHDEHRQPDERLTGAERELEAALRSLAPTRATIDRDRLMYDAGRRSARPAQLTYWRAAAGALAAALVLSLLLRSPREVERIVHVNPPPPSAHDGAGVVAASDVEPSRRSYPERSDLSYLVLLNEQLEARSAPAIHNRGDAGRADEPNDVIESPRDAGLYGRARRTGRESL